MRHSWADGASHRHQGRAEHGPASMMDWSIGHTVILPSTHESTRRIAPLQATTDSRASDGGACQRGCADVKDSRAVATLTWGVPPSLPRHTLRIPTTEHQPMSDDRPAIESLEPK